MREQLIAAIEDDPEDIENYRVYADWLESNGQPRGQLIAMELLRERLTDRSKLEYLRRKISAYFHEHRAAFLAGLDHWGEQTYDTGHANLRWRYGFIHTAQVGVWNQPNDTVRLRELIAAPSGRFLVGVALDAKSSPALLAALRAHVPASLRQLTTRSMDLDLSDAWPDLVRLTHLGLHAPGVILGTIDLPNLVSATVTDSHLRELRDARIPRLATLRIERPREPTRLITLLETLAAPALRRLEIEHASDADEIAAQISRTALGARLVEIDLGSSDLTDAGARAWAENPPPVRHGKLVVTGNNQLTRIGHKLLRDHVASEVVTGDDA